MTAHAVEPVVDRTEQVSTVFIAGLEMPAQIGVHSEERGRLQSLVFDIEVRVTPPRADDLADTVDYDLIAEHIGSILGAGHIRLVETVARQVAETIATSPQVLEVIVRVSKPSAMAQAKAAGVIWTVRPAH